MELSIIIVSYNAKDYLKNCLCSVLKAADGIACEIFIIDNNSSDGSREMLKQEFPGLNLIFNDENRGFAAANNQGIRNSKGKKVLLLNPDTLVDPDCFIKCLAFIDKHPDAGAVGVKMADGNGLFLPESKRALPSLATSFFKISGIASLLSSSGFFNRYYLPETGTDEISTVEVISGAFMLISREALEKAGLPDEGFFMYGEDIDLSYRLLKAGYKNYYYPETRIIHFKGKCTDRNGFDDIRHFYNAMHVYVQKRQKENFRLLYLPVIPAIYFREFLSIAIRYISLKLRK